MDDAIRPKHYSAHPTGIECIEVAQHFNFNVGNVIKYVWRAGLKSPNIADAICDLQKAAMYIQFEIERLEEKELKNSIKKTENNPDLPPALLGETYNEYFHGFLPKGTVS